MIHANVGFVFAGQKFTAAWQESALAAVLIGIINPTPGLCLGAVAT